MHGKGTFWGGPSRIFLGGTTGSIGNIFGTTILFRLWYLVLFVNSWRNSKCLCFYSSHVCLLIANYTTTHNSFEVAVISYKFLFSDYTGVIALPTQTIHNNQGNPWKSPYILSYSKKAYFIDTVGGAAIDHREISAAGVPAFSIHKLIFEDKSHWDFLNLNL